jgi:hypothetical protein
MKCAKSVKYTFVMSQNWISVLQTKHAIYSASRDMPVGLFVFVRAVYDWIQDRVYTRLIKQSEIQSETWKHIPQLDAACTKRKKRKVKAMSCTNVWTCYASVCLTSNTT